MDEEKESLEGVIPEMCDDATVLIDHTEKITDLLHIWEEINTGLKSLETVNEKIRTKIKNYLKEREWKHYNDKETKISISISSIDKEQIDKSQLKMILSDTQYAQITNIKTHERMDIITPKRRKELNKIVR